MQKKHADDAVDGDALGHVIGEGQGVEGEVPAMFGGVFAATSVAKGVGPQDGFQPVSLVQKGELLIEPGRHVSVR